MKKKNISVIIYKEIKDIPCYVLSEVSVFFKILFYVMNYTVGQ